LADIAHINGTGDQFKGKSRIRSNTKLRLHSKMPLIAVLGLVDLKVEPPMFAFRTP
jgi:hypothetical protein